MIDRRQQELGDRGARVGEEIPMAEHESLPMRSLRVRSVAVHRDALLVAPVAARLPLQREPVVRAEIHVHRAPGYDHPRRPRGVVEQRDGHIRRQSSREVV